MEMLVCEPQEVGLVCCICKQRFKNFLSFAKHIKHQHKITSQQYYDQYILNNCYSGCVICNSATKFINIKDGYKKTCSHKCGGIMHQQNLKNDPNRYQIYINKVKNNLKNKHANRTPQEKIEYRQKISNTRKNNTAKLTEQERKEKFGWLNRLSFKDKKKFVKEVLLKTGAHKWWENATEEEKNKIFKKRAQTMKLKNQREVLTLFKDYRAEVTYLTQQTYKKYKDIINSTKLKRGFGSGLYHIDHKYSVLQGFIDKIPCEVIASKYNLQMLEQKDNLKKHKQCSITKEELFKLYEHDKT